MTNGREFEDFKCQFEIPKIYHRNKPKIEQFCNKL